MEYEEKIKKYLDKTTFEFSQSKTSWEEFPVKFKYGMETHNPDEKITGGMVVAVIPHTLWGKYLDYPWFKVYGNFNKDQVKQMFDICTNDLQIHYLISMLSCTEQ